VAILSLDPSLSHCCKKKTFHLSIWPPRGHKPFPVPSQLCFEYSQGRLETESSQMRKATLTTSAEEVSETARLAVLSLCSVWPQKLLLFHTAISNPEINRQVSSPKNSKNSDSHSLVQLLRRCRRSLVWTAIR
jgi:hypothetical protein